MQFRILTCSTEYAQINVYNTCDDNVEEIHWHLHRSQGVDATIHIEMLTYTTDESMFAQMHKAMLRIDAKAKEMTNDSQ